MTNAEKESKKQADKAMLVPKTVFTTQTRPIPFYPALQCAAA
jgi:hypothetical protein